MSAVFVSSAFDSGNIEVLDASDANNLRLAIRTDVGGEHLQWFHFRVAGGRGVALTLRIENAGKCSYPGGWPDYRARVSTDRETWTLADTTYEDGVLTIHHTPDADVVWFAYFAPYSHERHQDLLARCQASPLARVDRLGATIDGRDLDRITIGTPAPGRKTAWVIARQHPGESMAEWWMEGFLARMLDPRDSLARRLREAAVFHVVPNMNPDGSFRGHLRCNAVGANLNREWETPTAERSPEVLWVRNAMDESGVDFCLDVHGDEALPYNFIAGSEGIPGFTPRLAGLLEQFKAAYMLACPDFQTRYGYPVSAPGKANMTMCTSQVAQRFNCLAMTLEMPFKDNADLPDAEVGWSPARCRNLGAAVLHAVDAVMSGLR
jgi:murein tripeptide amidase MpaA